MPSRLSRLARAIVRRYPKAWRQRYEIEIAGFIEDAPAGWRDVLDLARGCVVERARAFVEPEAHPTRAWMLLGLGRYVTALALYAVIVAAAVAVRRAFGEPPASVGYVGFGVSILLMLVGLVAYFRALRPTPLAPVQRVPARARVAAWLFAYAGALVLVYWSFPPDRLFSHLSGWSEWYVHPMFIMAALGLYAPSIRRLSGTLMRIGGLREQLGWARMELTRCESLAADGVASADLVRARDEVARLERELASAVRDVRRPSRTTN